MNREPEVSQITKDNLQAAIRSKLFILPAFRLKGKQIDVFKTALHNRGMNGGKFQCNVLSAGQVIFGRMA